MYVKKGDSTENSAGEIGKLAKMYAKMGNKTEMDAGQIGNLAKMYAKKTALPKACRPESPINF